MRTISLPALAAFSCSLLIACGDGASGPAGGPSTGPVADLSEELTGGNGPFVGEATPGALEAAGYVQQEFVAAGTATSYTAEDPVPTDGRWTWEPSESASYRTRVLVRRPSSASAFSGAVIVEWLNVSGGVDANPDFASLEEEILREGHVWVGVSAQLIGVEGGPTIVEAPGTEGLGGQGLIRIDPARYGSLSHPGDGFSFDIFTQIARAVRDGAGLGDLAPDRVIAAGESQSAIALVSYYNGVQPLTDAFDGFLVHSRAFVGLPLVGPGEFADLAGGLAGPAVLVRGDLEAPVLEIQAEGDVTGLLNSSLVRQPDTPTFRLWEVAGTAHADRHLLGPIADIVECGVDVNDAPFHLVVKAAMNHLDRWVRTGQTPPTAPRLELTSDPPAASQRDVDGITLGGIRTPPVDVPVDVLSGEPGPSADILCLLLGSTTPLSDARIGELYASRADYEQQFRDAADRVIDQGYVLEADRSALLDFAQPERVAP